MMRYSTLYQPWWWRKWRRQAARLPYSGRGTQAIPGGLSPPPIKGGTFGYKYDNIYPYIQQLYPDIPIYPAIIPIC